MVMTPLKSAPKALRMPAGVLWLSYGNRLEACFLSEGVRVRKMEQAVRTVGAQIPHGRDRAQSRLCQSLFFSKRHPTTLIRILRPVVEILLLPIRYVWKHRAVIHGQPGPLKVFTLPCEEHV